MDNRAYMYNDIPRYEWSAVYGENMVRQQLDIPLRMHYITANDPSGVAIGGDGPRMIAPGNTPIRPLYKLIPKPATLIK